MASLVRRLLDRAATSTETLMTETPTFQPPAAADLPDGALDSATAGASMLDGPVTEYGRNVLAHALCQLQRDGWLRQEPAAFFPSRGDHVEAWLKQQRDQFNAGSPVWIAFDHQLDDYRLHADTGMPLHEHCCEGGNRDDRAGCHDTKAAGRG